MNGFTFYKNYYELIKCLKNNERLKIYDAMLEYMFEDKEPEFSGLTQGVWVNLKMPLNTSKSKGGRGGAPQGNTNAKKTTKKQPKNNQTTTKKQTNNISYFLFLISNNKYKYINNKNLELINKIEEWLKYKEERKELYKEIGLKNLLTEIENNIEKFGIENVIELISQCMARNYKGIIFEKLGNLKTVKAVPKWFHETITNEELDQSMNNEFSEFIKEFREG